MRLQKSHRRHQLSNKHPVSLAFLQAPTTMHGVFNGATSISKRERPGIQLFYTDLGLYVEFEGLYGIIPHANIKVCVLEKPTDETVS